MGAVHRNAGMDGSHSRPYHLRLSMDHGKGGRKRVKCNEIREIASDPKKLGELKDENRINTMFHLRRCDECKAQLSAEQYVLAVQALVLEITA